MKKHALLVSWMKEAPNGEGLIPATAAIPLQPEQEADRHAVERKAVEVAVRGFWFNHCTFIPPASLVALKIVET